MGNSKSVSFAGVELHAPPAPGAGLAIPVDSVPRALEHGLRVVERPKKRAVVHDLNVNYVTADGLSRTVSPGVLKVVGGAGDVEVGCVHGSDVVLGEVLRACAEFVRARNASTVVVNAASEKEATLALLSTWDGRDFKSLKAENKVFVTFLGDNESKFWKKLYASGKAGSDASGELMRSALLTFASTSDAFDVSKFSSAEAKLLLAEAFAERDLPGNGLAAAALKQATEESLNVERYLTVANRVSPNDARVRRALFYLNDSNLTFEEKLSESVLKELEFVESAESSELLHRKRLAYNLKAYRVIKCIADEKSDDDALSGLIQKPVCKDAHLRRLAIVLGARFLNENETDALADDVVELIGAVVEGKTRNVLDAFPMKQAPPYLMKPVKSHPRHWPSLRATPRSFATREDAPAINVPVASDKLKTALKNLDVALRQPDLNREFQATCASWLDSRIQNVDSLAEYLASVRIAEKFRKPLEEISEAFSEVGDGHWVDEFYKFYVANKGPSPPKADFLKLLKHERFDSALACDIRALLESVFGLNKTWSFKEMSRFAEEFLRNLADDESVKNLRAYEALQKFAQRTLKKFPRTSSVAHALKELLEGELSLETLSRIGRQQGLSGAYDAFLMATGQKDVVLKKYVLEMIELVRWLVDCVLYGRDLLALLSEYEATFAAENKSEEPDAKKSNVVIASVESPTQRTEVLKNFVAARPFLREHFKCAARVMELQLEEKDLDACVSRSLTELDDLDARYGLVVEDVLEWMKAVKEKGVEKHSLLLIFGAVVFGFTLTDQLRFMAG